MPRCAWGTASFPHGMKAGVEARPDPLRLKQHGLWCSGNNGLEWECEAESSTVVTHPPSSPPSIVGFALWGGGEGGSQQHLGAWQVTRCPTSAGV